MSSSKQEIGMISKKNAIWWCAGLVILLLLSVIGARVWRKYREEMAQPRTFFEHPSFPKENFFLTFSLLNPDTVVENIKRRVPLKWHNLACEMAYYNLTARHKGISDTAQFALLDAYDKSFPTPATHIFTNMIRGGLFSKTYQFDTASICLTRAYAGAKAEHDSIRAADVERSIGLLEMYRFNYPIAIHHLLNVYDSYTRLLKYPNTGGRDIEVMLDLGYCYYYNTDYQEAGRWYNKLLKTAHTYYSGYGGIKLLANTAIARNYLALGKLDSANLYIDSAFYYQQLFRSDTALYNQHLFDSNYATEYQYFALGEIQIAEGNCDTARANMEIALANPLQPYLVPLPHLQKGLADSYACLGKNDSAIYYYQQALQSRDSILQIEVYRNLALTFVATQQHEKAVNALMTAYKIQEKVLSANKLKEVGYLTARYDAAQAEQAILFEKRRRNNLLWFRIVSFILLALAFCFVVLWLRQRTNLLRETTEKLAIEQRLKELELTKAKQELKNTTIALQMTVEELDVKNKLLKKLEKRLESSTSIQEYDITSQEIRILTHQDWIDFQYGFENAFPGFLDSVNRRFPNLSNSEVRLILLLKTGFKTSELEAILGISTKSVYTNRYRLRKKLALGEEEDLDEFINKL
ncbi:MAG: hypothetical protein HC892_22020 [Saprospiraceae bacterium]|nr:hypothetical protein [Saprospiraceae bacterium]